MLSRYRSTRCCRVAANAPGFISGDFMFFSVLQDFSEWRDPDSNRGHHDFQSGLTGSQLSAIVQVYRLPKPISPLSCSPMLVGVSGCVGVAVGVPLPSLL